MCFLKKDLYNKDDVFHVDKINVISLWVFFSKTFKIWNNIFLLKKLKKNIQLKKVSLIKQFQLLRKIFFSKRKKIQTCWQKLLLVFSLWDKSNSTISNTFEKYISTDIFQLNLTVKRKYNHYKLSNWKSVPAVTSDSLKLWEKKNPSNFF